MESPDQVTSFLTSGAAYDAFMGRYSNGLAESFIAAARVTSGQVVLDIGCGPGALTGALVRHVGAPNVFAFDPSPPFVADCRARYPGVDVRNGRVEDIPFDDASFDAVLAQLVWHFASDPTKGAQECKRVLRPGGTIAAAVWDFGQGMEMLRLFWDAALAIDPDAPDEARTLRFGAVGELAQLFESAGFIDVEETMLEVDSTYDGFTDLWSGFMAGIGPAGTYCLSLDEPKRELVREEFFRLLGSPTAPFRLSAKARCAVATKPTS
jgi:SAM-dependent methyltransferase